MGVLSVYHPDIVEFVTAKSKDEKKLRHFNVSVMVDNKFMNAVENDEEIYLHWPVYDENGFHVEDKSKWKVSKKVKAREIWDLIMKNAYNNGEPGIFFYDNLNDDNDIWYKERIVCTNPCFTGDMKLLTTDGYKKFSELEGEENLTIIDKDGDVSYGNKVWCSGEKEIVRVEFSNGSYIKCTPNHVFMLNNGKECQAKDLSRKRVMPLIEICKPEEFDNTYVKLGFMQGDGELTRLKSKHHKGFKVNIGEKDSDILKLFDGEKFLSDNYIVGYKEIMEDLGFSSETLPYRVLPKSYNDWDKKKKLSFLRGMFSANGSVVAKYRIQYKTTCKDLVCQLKDALLEFGINSNITTNKQKSCKFKNGEYTCRESYDLCINQYNSIMGFAKKIGFVHNYKNESLCDLIKYRAPSVKSVKYFGKEKVYDFTENNQHWGIVEGFVVHNCAEYLAGTVYGDNTVTKEKLNPSDYGGACNLGSLFLHNFVSNPFSKKSKFEYDKLRKTIYVAVRMLDDIIDVNHFPDKIYENYQKAFRTIGLGVTGLADTIAMLGMKYNSLEAREWVDDLMNFISSHAFKSSAEIAEEKGVFPFFEKDKYIEGGYLKRHFKYNRWKDTKDAICKYGIRNAKIMSVAPTGTISMTFGNNCSSGIEPIFCLEYERKVKIGGQDDSNIKIVPMQDYAYKIWKDMGEPEEYKDVFVTALEMTVDEHVDMLSKISKHVDMSVSKTINVPTEYPFEDTKDIYMKCWKLGIKGCTIFRPNEIRQGILISDSTTVAEKKEEMNYNTVKPISRKKIGTTSGKTYCKKCACGTLYITVNCDDDGNVVEAFVHTSKGGICQANINALTRMASLNMRSGVEIEEIVDQLKGITCPACAKLMAKGESLSGISCPDILGKTIKEFYDTKNSCANNAQEEKENHRVENKDNTNSSECCPECGAKIIRQGGCVQCLDCGWSKCE